MLQKELVPQVEPIPGTEHPGISRLSTPILALARPNSDKARGYPKPAAIGCPMPNAAPQTTKSPGLENFQGGAPTILPVFGRHTASRIPHCKTARTNVYWEGTNIYYHHPQEVDSSPIVRWAAARLAAKSTSDFRSPKGEASEPSPDNCLDRYTSEQWISPQTLPPIGEPVSVTNGVPGAPHRVPVLPVAPPFC